VSRTNQEGIKLIKDFEKLELNAYNCATGHCTIGWGCTYYKDKSPVKIGDRINEVDAEDLFNFHLKIAEDIVSSVLMVTTTENEFAALVAMAFNVKPIPFKNSTLIKLLNKNEDRKIVSAEFLRWNKGEVIVNGEKKLVPIAGLTRRREAERQLFLKP